MSDDKDDAATRMSRRQALIASAKEAFQRIQPRERDALEYGVQTADDQALTVIRLSRSLDR
jgi:hypothetical protein